VLNKDAVKNEKKALEDRSENENVPKKLTPREYISWMDDKKNGLKVEKMIGEFTYMFQYKPAEYVAIMDIKKDNIKKPELDKKMEEYNAFQYYNFRISTEAGGELLKKNVVNENDYYGRIQYFSFDMQKDIKLIDNKDTLDCVLFHFERVFGLAPYATFLLGFPLKEKDCDKTLYYDDKIFGAGRMYLTIKSKNIKNIPSVIVD
jgi:hypothetical protein